MNAWRKIVLGVSLGMYLLGMGMLIGVVIERMRFNRQRSEVLARYEGALREWQTHRIALEKDAGRPR